MNGELVDWDDATVHVGAHGAPLRLGRVRGHPLLRDAARAGGLPADRPHAPARDVRRADLHDAAVLGRRARRGDPRAALARTGCRPATSARSPSTATARSGVPPRENPVDVAIMSWPWGTYLGAEALEKGIRAKVSTWRRVGPNTIPHAAKATGVYLNSMLAVHGGEPRRVRGGDPPDRGRLRRRRLRREHLRRQGRRDLHARPLGLDPARASRGSRSSRSPAISATRCARSR